MKRNQLPIDQLRKLIDARIAILQCSAVYAPRKEAASLDGGIEQLQWVNELLDMLADVPEKQTQVVVKGVLDKVLPNGAVAAVSIIPARKAAPVSDASMEQS